MKICSNCHYFCPHCTLAAIGVYYVPDNFKSNDLLLVPCPNCYYDGFDDNERTHYNHLTDNIVVFESIL